MARPPLLSCLASRWCMCCGMSIFYWIFIVSYDIVAPMTMTIIFHYRTILLSSDFNWFGSALDSPSGKNRHHIPLLLCCVNSHFLFSQIQHHTPASWRMLQLREGYYFILGETWDKKIMSFTLILFFRCLTLHAPTLSTCQIQIIIILLQSSLGHVIVARRSVTAPATAPPLCNLI